MGFRQWVTLTWMLTATLAAALEGADEPRDPRPQEQGFPLMRLFDDTDHGGAPQNFGLATDARGYVYVGNLQYVLIWDGARWRQVPTETAAYKVATNADGQVLVGGPQSLAIIEPQAGGSPGLRSIVPLLPASERGFGDVRSIVATSEGFVVLTDARLLVYNGRTLRTTMELPREAPKALITFGSETYLRVGRTLQKLNGDPLPRADALARLDGHEVDAVIEESEGARLAIVRDLGLVRVDAKGLHAIRGTTSEWAKRNVVSCALRLRDGRIAFGSRAGGVLLANRVGEAEQVINAARGLPDDQVAQITEDREGFLWVAMNAGLARLDVASSITVFDARVGVLGGSQGIHRHAGRLFVFGSAGVGVLENGALRKIPGIAGSTWSGLDLPETPGDFLVAAAPGIFRVSSDRATLLPGTGDLGAYTLEHARNFDGILVGARAGLHLLLRTAAGYRLIGPLAGTPRYVRSIAVRPSGRAFFATVFDGIVSVDFDPKNPASARFRKLGGIEGDVHVSPDGLRAITADERPQLFAVDEDTPRLIPDPARTRSLLGLPAWVSASDAAGNLWVNTSPLRVFPRIDGVLSAQPLILHAFPARRIQMIRPEPDGVVWVGGENGLYRHVGPPGDVPATPPSPVIAAVTVDDREIFDGWSGKTTLPSCLPQNLRRLRVEFSPLSQQRGLAYQFRLEPIDREWSEWSPRTDVEFTTLQEAHYRFAARTRGADGRIGKETAWTFLIDPPWYRTLAARLASLLALGLFVTGAVALRTRVLKREARHLTERVEERTRDLKRAVLDLEASRLRVEEQNRQLGEANARLEDVSRHDPLTGIANRRQFDLVFQEEWLRARRDQAPLVVGILDLDHFKALNDTFGHLEGDAALRRVAATVEATMRRPGDMVARYGGEEFAFILSGTDLQGALRVAEDARARIEALNIPNPGCSLGRLTASVGLVVAVPVEGIEATSLIEAADHALYGAKSADAIASTEVLAAILRRRLRAGRGGRSTPAAARGRTTGMKSGQ